MENELVLFVPKSFHLYNSFLKQKNMNHTVIIVLYSIQFRYDDLLQLWE